jgi:CRP-like cAMP-binding protein
MRKVFYLLGQLTDADIEWLLAHGTRKRVRAGDVLIPAGEQAQALYILLAGTLIVSFDPSSNRSPIRLECGDIAGEMSFIDSHVPSARVAAVDDAIVFAIDRKALAAKLDADNAFAGRFYHSIAVFMSHRLREASLRPEGLPPAEDVDELDMIALHAIQRAAFRFDRVLQRLLAE